MNPNDTCIELITCESGDWEILKVNQRTFDQGHNVDWVELLKYLGYNFKEEYLTDELMEELYGCR